MRVGIFSEARTKLEKNEEKQKLKNDILIYMETKYHANLKYL